MSKPIGPLGFVKALARIIQEKLGLPDGVIPIMTIVFGYARGPANRVYLNVCRKFNLSDGAHSARVYAENGKGNSADTGTVENVIRCRR